MASTNKTANYELSQYVGGDKPTYLGDYNADMLKIDTQMKTNATNIASVGAIATTASDTANTAIENATSARTSAENAQTSATTANNTATTALNKANENENKITNLEQNIIYQTTLESNQTSLVINNLNILRDKGYEIFINGTLDDANQQTGALLTMNAMPTGTNMLLNRLMGYQITPVSPTVDKIANDNYTRGLCLNRFTNGLGGISHSIIMFRPTTGTENSNLASCISNFGIANSINGATGQITTVYRGDNMTNITSLTITPTSGVMRAGMQIVVKKIGKQ